MLAPLIYKLLPRLHQNLSTGFAFADLGVVVLAGYQLLYIGVLKTSDFIDRLLVRVLELLLHFQILQLLVLLPYYVLFPHIISHTLLNFIPCPSPHQSDVK